MNSDKFDGVAAARKVLAPERACDHPGKGECCTGSPPHCYSCCLYQSCWLSAEALKAWKESQ